VLHTLLVRQEGKGFAVRIAPVLAVGSLQVAAQVVVELRTALEAADHTDLVVAARTVLEEAGHIGLGEAVDRIGLEERRIDLVAVRLVEVEPHPSRHGCRRMSQWRQEGVSGARDQVSNQREG